MKHFAISDVVHYSGIKAHTLRIWEQRYGLPKPQRINGHARSYTLDEFRLLLNIALLNKSGIKISHLSKLSELNILIQLKNLANGESRYLMAMNQLVAAMYTLDTEQFEHVLDDCFISFSSNVVFNKIIYRFLKMTGLLWQGSRQTEEHLAVTILRKKILWAIENAHTSSSSSGRVLLFLPDTKQLDLGLLYMQYFLKSRGMQVLYMGNDVSISNLKAVSEKIKPDYYYTYLFRKNKFELDELNAYLNLNLPFTKLILTAPDIQPDVRYNSTVIQKNFDDALVYFSNVDQQALPQHV